MLPSAASSNEDPAHVLSELLKAEVAGLSPTPPPAAEQPRDATGNDAVESLLLSADDNDDDENRELCLEWITSEGAMGESMSSEDRVEPDEGVTALVGRPPLMPGGWLPFPAEERGPFDGEWSLINPTPETSRWLTSLQISGLDVVDGTGEEVDIDFDRRGCPRLVGGKLTIAGEALIRVGRCGRVLVYLPARPLRD